MDLLLDENTHDLVFKDGDLKQSTQDTAIRQHLKQRYLFYFGEWFLDNTKGVPYYQYILVKNPNIDLVEATLRNVVLTTPGILQLDSFTLEYDNKFRTISPSLQAQSSSGEINFQTTVGI